MCWVRAKDPIEDSGYDSVLASQIYRIAPGWYYISRVITGRGKAELHWKNPVPVWLFSSQILSGLYLGLNHGLWSEKLAPTHLSFLIILLKRFTCSYKSGWGNRMSKRGIWFYSIRYSLLLVQYMKNSSSQISGDTAMEKTKMAM
jgi:hypothetical protein